MTVRSLLDSFHNSIVLGTSVHSVDLINVHIRETRSNTNQVDVVWIDSFHCHLATAKCSFPIMHHRSVIIWSSSGVNSISRLFLEVVLDMIWYVLPVDLDVRVPIRTTLL